LATSPYERDKYDHTLSVLSDRRYADAFEVGCANGVLTLRLADICDRLLAIDVSETALKNAKARCAERPDVRFERMVFPRETPREAGFDLIVLSEVAYYWDDADFVRAASWLAAGVRPGGRIVMVHWTGETDYPQTGDQAASGMISLLGDPFAIARQERREGYRLDLLIHP
jgi:SAM-dependent methyltransferase